MARVGNTKDFEFLPLYEKINQIAVASATWLYSFYCLGRYAGVELQRNIRTIFVTDCEQAIGSRSIKLFVSGVETMNHLGAVFR